MQVKSTVRLKSISGTKISKSGTKSLSRIKLHKSSSSRSRKFRSRCVLLTNSSLLKSRSLEMAIVDKLKEEGSIVFTKTE